jgi:hypothetical protein
MNYERFKEILNRHIFEGEKRDLLKKLAERPERFIGLFRPTKPGTKILQHLLQSHEIRFGDAIEELFTEIIGDLKYRNLPKDVRNSNGETLSIDQYFTDGNTYYFIEQKVRDDHDSTKKRGQINNFERKLEVLHNLHEDNLIGIMYFIDPDLRKNQNFYIEKLEGFSNFYGVKLYLFYGRELFTFFNNPQVWDDLIQWLTRWKDDLPELPEINFDGDSEESFEEIKELEIRYWRKIIQNEKLWEEGIIYVLFKTGETLRSILEYFKQQYSTPYRNLARLLTERLRRYYDSK